MARVFLSYDREDSDRARPIALALEKAGHTVWWDLHIKGGEQYSRAIDEALSQSDAIIVLWSCQSVDSAWVRDEAAVGRERGRLIPVLIDKVQPPLGFRQYQNIDLSRWKGRGKAPNLAEITASIDALAGGVRPEPRIAPIETGGERKFTAPRWSIALITVIVLAGVAALIFRDRAPSDVHTVAVTSADAEARPLARDLLVNLGRLQSARSGSLRLIGPGGHSSANPELIFEAASDSEPDRVGASLVLMAGKDRSLLWSKVFEQESGKIADLKQQIAITAARVLGCALEGLSTPNRPLEQQTLKLYLNACSDLAETASSDPAPVIPTLLQVIEKSPRFEPAWQKLLLAEAEVTGALMTNVRPSLAERKRLTEHIKIARKLNPNMAEAFIADLALLPRDEIEKRQAIVERAIARSPDNVHALNERSTELRSVGRMRESIEYAERATELDPLSPVLHNSYISALAYAGQIDAAKEELARAERLWPGTATLRDIQYRFHLRFGDPRQALRLTTPETNWEGIRLFLEARADPTPHKIDQLLNHIRGLRSIDSGALGFVTQALGEFHREDELYDIVLRVPPQDIGRLGDIWFRPALRKFRQDPRFMQLAAKGGLAAYWRKSGQWPDFCAEPDWPYDCKKEAAKLLA